MEEGSEGAEEGGGHRGSWWWRSAGDVAVVESGGLEEKGEGKGGPEPTHRITHRKNRSPYQRLPTLWLLLRVGFFSHLPKKFSSSLSVAESKA